MVQFFVQGQSHRVGKVCNPIVGRHLRVFRLQLELGESQARLQYQR
jgi:hypothetical protein